VTAGPWEAGRLPAPLVPLERTFEGFLDLEWLALSPGAARVRFRVRDDLKQPLGLLHGGIYNAVAETIASVATVHEVWDDGFTAAGLGNSSSFLRPVTGGTLEVEARLHGRTETEWLWGHDFRDEDGRLCAVVDVTIAVRPRSA
jgi:1,4-dihydroxy-2-naphthoyl-CoA hydrolase